MLFDDLSNGNNFCDGPLSNLMLIILILRLQPSRLQEVVA
jgi:hypothetical protein